MSTRRCLSRKENESEINPYDGLVGDSFVLRNIYQNHTEAVLKLRRISDNAETYVFFDSSGEISLSSLTDATSTTTPSATTLGTWVGSNDAYLSAWYPVNQTGLITKLPTTSPTTASQPKFISSGIIETENGKPCLVFSGAQVTEGGSNYAFISTNNDFTLFNLSANHVANNAATIYASTTGDISRFSLFNDRRADALITNARTSANNATTYFGQQNISSQKLLSGTHAQATKELRAWYNKVEQNSKTYSSFWNGGYMRIGADINLLVDLNGTIQQLSFFSSVLTDAQIDAINDEIANYYGIP